MGSPFPLKTGSSPYTTIFVSQTRTPLSGSRSKVKVTRPLWLAVQVSESLHDLYGRHHDHSLLIMNIHCAGRVGRRQGRRMRKACRLWTRWAAACVQRAGRWGGAYCVVTRRAMLWILKNEKFLSLSILSQ